MTFTMIGMLSPGLITVKSIVCCSKDIALTADGFATASPVVTDILLVAAEELDDEYDTSAVPDNTKAKSAPIHSNPSHVYPKLKFSVAASTKVKSRLSISKSE